MKRTFIKKFILALLKTIMFFVLASILTIEDANDAILLDNFIQPLAWIAGLICALNLVWQCLDSGVDWKIFIGFIALAFLGNIVSSLATVIIALTGAVIALEGLRNFSDAAGYFSGAFSSEGTKYNRVIAFCKFTYPIAITLVGASLVCFIFSFYDIFMYVQIACYVAAVAHIIEAIMLICLKREGYID